MQSRVGGADYLFIYLLSDLQSRSLNIKCPIVTLKKKSKKTASSFNVFSWGAITLEASFTKRKHLFPKKSYSAAVIEPGYIYQKTENQGNMSWSWDACGTR